MDENVVAISISRDRWNAPKRRRIPLKTVIFRGDIRNPVEITVYCNT
jgi:hypothetical protein